MRVRLTSIGIIALLATSGGVWAQSQAPDTSGARAGSSYVPSTHSPGCGGIMCDGNDPQVIAHAPPPACGGILCGMTPYSMARPVTASDAQRMQEEHARAEAAAAAAAPPAAVEPVRHRRIKTAKKAAAKKAVAVRTPDPTPPAATAEK